MPEVKQRELFTRFKVEKFLGKGAYGSVYRVKRSSDDKCYAVKEMDVTKMSMAERKDCANEIRLLASVKHPNIVRYYEAFLDGNWLCIVMEYAACGDLAHYIKKGAEYNTPFPEPILWTFILQVMRGVEDLHEKKIVHRDIKPANTFIGKGDTLKIGDLGVAKILNKQAPAQTQIGTPHYMAPEVFHGKPYSLGADVWSLGCMLYEMMMYKVPFSGKSMPELKRNVCEGRYAPITANYSSELKQLCMDMLTVDAAKRPTVAALIQRPEIQAKMRALPVIKAEEKHVDMVHTIVVPRELKQMAHVFPEARYDAIPASGA